MTAIVVSGRVQLGVMEVKTLYRAGVYRWYEDWCPATCDRMKRKGLITIGHNGRILLTDTGRVALTDCQDVLAGWGWVPPLGGCNMACFRCRATGEIICDPEEAELRCEVCGKCRAPQPVVQPAPVVPR